MSRLACLLIVGTLTLPSLGQDPTIPSAAILEKLKRETSSTVHPDQRVLPKIKLKAIVMIDQNRGVATIEADGQRYRLRLERTSDPADGQSNAKAKAVNAVQIGGVQYSIEDFGARTIVLTDGVHQILVH